LEKKLSEGKDQRDDLIFANRLALVKRANLNLRALDNNVKLTPAMVDLLELSPEEQRAVEQHLAEIQAKTQELDDARVTLVDAKFYLMPRTSTDTTCVIPAYPEGKALKAQLAGLLATDIGPERADILMNNGGNSFKSLFSNFGEQKTLLDIRQLSASHYWVGEYYLAPGDQDESVTAHATSNIMTSDGSLPDHWAELIKHLPPP